MIILRNDIYGFGRKYVDILRSFYTPNLAIEFVEYLTVKCLYNCENTPFCCNPGVIYQSRNANDSVSMKTTRIVYNEKIIKQLNLSNKEIHACITHEIGHIINYNNMETDPQKKEIQADSMAICFSLSSALCSALIKMHNEIPVFYIQERLSNLVKSITYYRAPWTCGRYNDEKKVAIFYNLMDSQVFFFENDSAEIIKFILNVKKNTKINLDVLTKDNSDDILEIIKFLEILKNTHILLDRQVDDRLEKCYRYHISKQRKTPPKGNIQNEKTSPIDAELLYLERVKKPGIATSITFELTYRCSERCIHCYNQGATRNPDEISTRNRFNELSFDDYKKIIDDLHQRGLVKACITGGDPFSKDICWDIINYLKEKDIAIDIYTNGQNLIGKTSKIAAIFPRSIGISIYSSQQGPHDYITQTKGSWVKSMQVLKELSSFAVPVYLKCCIMKPNLKSYRGLSEIANQYGAVLQYELNIRESNDRDKSAKRLRLDPEELQVVLMDNIIPNNVMSDLSAFKGRVCDLELNTCMIGVDDFTINPAGDVQPCAAFPLSFGNIKGKLFSEIINDSNVIFKQWLSTKMKQFDKCGDFEYCKCCKPCAGLNYLEHLDYTKAAETSCYMAKIRYSLIEKIISGSDPLDGKSISEALQSLADNKQEPLKRDYYN